MRLAQFGGSPCHRPICTDHVTDSIFSPRLANRLATNFNQLDRDRPLGTNHGTGASRAMCTVELDGLGHRRGMRALGFGQPLRRPMLVAYSVGEAVDRPWMN